jgi:hypothetical protein
MEEIIVGSANGGSIFVHTGKDSTFLDILHGCRQQTGSSVRNCAATYLGAQHAEHGGAGLGGGLSCARSNVGRQGLHL